VDRLLQLPPAARGVMFAAGVIAAVTIIARPLRAILRRRVDWLEAAAEIELGAVTVDLAGHRLLRDGRPQPVKPKAFELLAFLIRHSGQAFSREQLLEHVWESDYVGETRTVDVHVHWLRAQIEEDPHEPRILQTVRGVGYVLRRPDQRAATVSAPP